MFAKLPTQPEPVTQSISMKERQAPLMQRYASNAEAGWIVDSAQTSSDAISPHDPIHTEVTLGIGIPTSQRIGVHESVGGVCDYPNPGEVLSAALASCLDTTIRIIANRLGIPLKRLSVRAEAHVNVCGTLRVDTRVPVGFQSIDIKVDIEAPAKVSKQSLEVLLKAAEQSCVVLQTLRHAPAIKVECDQLVA